MPVTEQSHYDAIIVGAGLSGIGAAVKLGEAGADYLIVDQAESVGGVWRANKYPSARCDAASVIYSYSFRPQVWSSTNGSRDEILEYLQATADEYAVTDHFLPSTRVASATWDDSAKRWAVALESSDGSKQNKTAKILVNATGLLSVPRKAQIANLDTFKGTVVHTAEWDRSINLQNKRVAIVGTGSSGTQLLAGICEEPGIQVTVFQRSFTGALPLEFKEYTPEEIADFKAHPEKLAELKAAKWGFFEHLVSNVFVGNPMLEEITKGSKGFMQAVVQDPELRKKLDYDHPFLAKRPIFSDRYFIDIQRSNVKLVTDPIVKATSTGIVVGDDQEIPLDVIALATGFSSTDYLPSFAVTGKGGKDLAEHFREIGGAEALYGTAIEGMPNYVSMLGPNTYNPHSIFAFVEKQADYTAALFTHLKNNKAKSILPKPDAIRKYNEFLDDQFFNKKHAQATAGVNNWFRSGSKGKITGAFPGTAATQFAFLEGQPSQVDFEFEM